MSPPLPEHLAAAPGWDGSGFSNVFDLRWNGKQTRLPVTFDLDPLFDMSEGTVDARNSGVVLCRLSGAERDMVTGMVGSLEVARVLLNTSRFTFALPGIPLGLSSKVSFKSETNLPGPCYQTGALGFRWTACSSQTIRTPLTSSKFTGSLPVKVSGTSGSFECRGVSSVVLDSVLGPRLKAVEQGLLQTCQSVSVKSGSPGSKLDESISALAALLGWADPRIAAALERRNAIHAGWLKANHPIPQGESPQLPTIIPSFKISKPLVCDQEAKKLYKWVNDEDTIPCRFEILVSRTKTPAKLAVSDGSIRDKNRAWSLHFEMLRADGKDLGQPDESPLPGGKEEADLDAGDVPTTWVVGVRKGETQGEFFLRVEASYTKPTSILPTSHHVFLALPGAR